MIIKIIGLNLGVSQDLLLHQDKNWDGVGTIKNDLTTYITNIIKLLNYQEEFGQFMIANKIKYDFKNVGIFKLHLSRWVQVVTGFIHTTVTKRK